MEDTTSFLECLTSILEGHVNKNTTVLGDFNLNLLRPEPTNTAWKYFNLMVSFGYSLSISAATRNSSLIDHIWANFSTESPKCYILNEQLSDHSMIFYSDKRHNATAAQTSNLKRIYFRLNTQRNINKLIEKLRSTNWTQLLSGSNVSINTDIFTKFIENTYHSFCPLQSKVVDVNKKVAPWMNKKLKQKFKQRFVYKKMLRENLISESFYNEYCNHVKGLANKAKNNYFQTQLNKCHTSKRKWSCLKASVNMCISKSNNITEISTPEGLISDKVQISNILNAHFANTCSTIVSSMQESEIDANSLLQNPFYRNFHFFECTESEVERTLLSLKTNNSSNNGFLPTLIINKVAKIIKTPICMLINMSFREGKFPNKLKHAFITPLFKSGERRDCNNYRPISQLPILSKVFEHIAHAKLSNFLNKFKLLSPAQFGFRKGIGTIHALHSVMHTVRKALNDKQDCIAVFIDLAKAFDTVDHTNLIHKLSHYGVRGVELQWFESFLRGRSQAVRLNGVTSESLDLTAGVPQGSVLGPLLFNIVINDLFLSHGLTSVSYADDCTVIASSRDCDELVTKVNLQLNRIQTWLNANKMKLNVEKTKFMYFTNRKRKSTASIKIKNTPIEECNYFKLLGVHIDNGLTFKKHIKALCNKLAFSGHILRRREYNLNLQQRRTIYNAYSASLLRYCVSIWGSTSRTALRPLVVTQNRLIKTFKKYYKIETTQIYQKLKVLKVEDLSKYEICCLMQGVVNGCSPIQNLFSSSDARVYSTRQSTNIQKPSVRLDLMKRDISWFGPHLWNELPNSLKNLSGSGFRGCLMNSLLAKYE